MCWPNIKLIWSREVRDQLRDRRTIFTIAVLPLLLYPLLGMSILQMTQFMKHHPTRILVVGSAALPAEPRLLANGRFAEAFCSPDEARLLQLTVEATPAERFRYAEPRSVAQQEIQAGTWDAVVYFPADFSERLSRFRARLAVREGAYSAAVELEQQAPQPEIFVNLASDKSRMAYARLEDILNRWRKEIVRQNLASQNVPLAATEPFAVASIDVSEEVGRRAAVWSKLLPFVVLIWALTGAFYPAIDLCAGEKERGTLETLLSSPAERIEIVWGKLLTVMVFSITTAVLNLLSMGVTGTLIIRQVEQLSDVGLKLDLAPPPVAAVGWLLLAVIPISALFSALALAIAAFARSSKEGQYYLMPLLLVTLPLMILPLLPNAELDLGSSLIPVTGMLLWLRALIEGQYVDALRYALPVIGITAACCWFAIRWAVHQFEDESVLFRESERFGLGLWMRHLMRDREDTPSVAEAVLCGVLLLLIVFFGGLHSRPPANWADFVQVAIATQLAFIAGPALIMTIMLTRSPRQTLLLNAPPPWAVPAALALAIILNPLVALLGETVQAMYPVSEETLQAIKPIVQFIRNQPLVYVVLLIGLIPAICEEVAFRGFILSGLRNIGNKWAAIVISSLFFGLTHGMIQQSLAAAMVGAVIGYIAVQTNSLLPGMVFHFTHNSFSAIASRVTPELIERYPLLHWILKPTGSDTLTHTYHLAWVVMSGVLGFALLLYFRRLGRAPCPSERPGEPCPPGSELA